MSSHTILDAVLRWCSRPYMFLLTARDRGQPDLHNLLLLLAGFECADPRQRSHEEWRQFELWLGKCHPGLFRQGVTWFGEGLLLDCGETHARAAERLRAYVEEYQALPAAERTVSQETPGAQVKPHTILESVVHWCSTPSESLATVSDHGQPDLDNLKLLLEGFMTGALQSEAGEQWHQFERWLGWRRPDLFREGLTWYGEGLLMECGGEHSRAAELLKTYVEEYQRSPPDSRGQT
ncbi:hypothetical protein CYFUS_001912 [Cystobacter fuscus]|uniref:Uncharacterized protein n=1 Tax=Cystobacter fuscus TaxID=43 RepID=A0A250IZ61_9BACT|nr:hypothetical protein CYFUS_001912 [Cystobacter fuscus]